MSMRFPSSRPICATALLAALLAAAPAGAETYKWVDERGVTTYSSSPPAGSKLPKKVDIVDERLSVYTPDAAILRATTPDAGRDAKIASLEAQLDAARRARSGAANANTAQAVYERCIADRRVDCDGHGPGGYAYAPVYVVGVARHVPFATPVRSRSFRSMR